MLCTYPIEHMAAATPRVNPEGTSVLYDALAVHAGVSRLVTVEDPRVAADILVHADGTRFAWLVSQAAEPFAVKPQLAAGLRLCALDGNAVKARSPWFRLVWVFSVSQAGRRSLAGREARAQPASPVVCKGSLRLAAHLAAAHSTDPLTDH